MPNYPLFGGSGIGALSVQAQMTRKALELYKKQIENSLSVIEATAVAPLEEKPGLF